MAVSCAIDQTFRVEQVAGLFDVPVAATAGREWAVEIPSLDEPWTIGAIVGPSGSGKSCIARAAYGKRFIEKPFAWPANQSVLDAASKGSNVSG